MASGMSSCAVTVSVYNWPPNNLWEYCGGDWESPKRRTRRVSLFDWPSCQEEAELFSSNPETLETADVLALRNLLTTRIRRDRFTDDTW